MMFDGGFLWWPFAAAGFGLMLLVGIALFAFWIWMIVDVAQRKFKESVEKIIWIVVVVVGGWVGALVYYIVVRMYNKQGLVRK
ncbi:hypothetical protein CMI45_00225 [Candidatus Pacearchaeota archaeon]|nr:hypothetical protein [Candidatus Pacearchaeota archaeon]